MSKTDWLLVCILVFQAYRTRVIQKRTLDEMHTLNRGIRIGSFQVPMTEHLVRYLAARARNDGREMIIEWSAFFTLMKTLEKFDDEGLSFLLKFSKPFSKKYHMAISQPTPVVVRTKKITVFADEANRPPVKKSSPKPKEGDENDTMVTPAS